MPKKVLLAMPPAMLQQVDFVSKQEHRTRSDLIREAVRRYLHGFNQAHPHISMPVEPTPPPPTPKPEPVTNVRQLPEPIPTNAAGPVIRKPFWELNPV